MPIRCGITWINGSALEEMCGVTREEILQVTQAKEIKAAPWFASLSAFDLRAVRENSPQMACMRFAAHCSPRYHRCHLVTPPTHTHQSQSQLTGLRVGTCPTALGLHWRSSGTSYRADLRRRQGQRSASAANAKECFK